MMKLIVVVFGSLILLFSQSWTSAAIVCEINAHSQAIESARAVMLLMDDSGKVVGQQTRWILMGTKVKPVLFRDAKSSFNFVIQSETSFTKTKMIVTKNCASGQGSR